jgi:hypothetical protein
MGIAFDSMEPHQREALDKWLAELTGERQSHAQVSAYAPNRTVPAGGGDRAALVRLIQLMITKGILTEAEGSSVMVDPLL